MPDLPITERMHMRPVWARRQRRVHHNINPLPPPTEAEQQDAIRVLEDPLNYVFAPALYAEAERIFHEAGG